MKLLSLSINWSETPYKLKKHVEGDEADVEVVGKGEVVDVVASFIEVAPERTALLVDLGEGGISKNVALPLGTPLITLGTYELILLNVKS